MRGFVSEDCSIDILDGPNDATIMLEFVSQCYEENKGDHKSKTIESLTM